MVYVDSRSGLDKLQAMHSIFVKQQFEMLEALTGCETENRYNVYYSNESGEFARGPPMFLAKEHSSWMARNCLQYTILIFIFS